MFKKIGLVVAALLLSAVAIALPPYGINLTQVDGGGESFWGYYMQPPDEEGQYVWMYDGTAGVPANNPFKMAVIGSGLSWNGTTLNTNARSFSYPTRSLNTCFQLSTTRDAQVSYPVQIDSSLSITGGAQGTVYMRTYTNSGCSTGTQEVHRISSGLTGTVVIGVAMADPVITPLHGVIPAGAYVQLVTENTVGTPTFTSRPGQEVLL